MVSHIAGRPHLFGRDYAGLLVAQETRLLTCKLCLKKYRKVGNDNNYNQNDLKLSKLSKTNENNLIHRKQ